MPLGPKFMDQPMPDCHGSPTHFARRPSFFFISILKEVSRKGAGGRVVNKKEELPKRSRRRRKWEADDADSLPTGIDVEAGGEEEEEREGEPLPEEEGAEKKKKEGGGEEEEGEDEE